MVPRARTVDGGLELEHLGLKQDGVQEIVDAVAGLCRDLHHHGVAAPLLGHHLVLRQLLHDLVRMGIRLVDLVDRDDDRDPGGTGVLDRLDGLRHHAVVGRHHQDDDVRDLRPASAHRREGGMAGGIEEGDRALGRLDVVGTDMLGDPARLA
jgi:hypothetical protein